jgi:hypothetical protein
VFIKMAGLMANICGVGAWFRLWSHPQISAVAASSAVSLACAISAQAGTCHSTFPNLTDPKAMEKQVTRGPGNRILTNTGVWSPDGEWIVYDTRPDVAGQDFMGSTIEMVNVETGEGRVLYRAGRGAHCGVATFNPRLSKVVFILGPEDPTPDWQYNASHRQGVIVDVQNPGLALNLDARDLVPPFTPGALRGGSHVHVWDAAGDWVSFTYEDHVLAQFKEATPEHEINLRNIAVSVPGHPVRVSKKHPRNHDGQYFTAVVSRTVAMPRPGTDDIERAFEEGWVGTNGYMRVDGSRQGRALAFQGIVRSPKGEPIPEVFIVDLPEDLTIMGNGPLAGTETTAPRPPKGCVQRRLTHTVDRKYPGIRGVRHWLRSSPDGSRIAFLMADDQGIPQIWTVSPNGGEPRQLTRNLWPIASAFTWSPDGQHLAHVMDNSVCATDATTGATRRLTQRFEDNTAPRTEACVFSPDGRQIAYARPAPEGSGLCNQIFVVRR